MYERFLLALFAIFSFCYVQAAPNLADTTANPADTVGKRPPSSKNEVTTSGSSQVPKKTTGRKVTPKVTPATPATVTEPEDADTTEATQQGTIKTTGKLNDNKPDTVDRSGIVLLRKKIDEQYQEIQQLHSRDFYWQLALGIGAVIIIAMLIALHFQHLKLKKMADQQAIREKIIEAYTDGVNSLQAYLVKCGLLNMQTTTIHDSPIKKKIATIKDKVTELVDKYLNEDARSTSIAADTESVRNKLKEVQLVNFELTKKLHQYENNDQPESAIQFVPYVMPERTAHIKTEIMISAGPRKEAGNTDTELGEDVAGMLSLPKQTFFWLMDGTSDSVKLSGGGMPHEESHVFSSRLLAQSIGQYIQKHITQCFQDHITLDKLLAQARDHVQQEWVQRINALPAEKKQSIKQLIHDGFKPLCSTTAIIGRLMENGHLHVLRAGDSKVFPFMQNNGGGATLLQSFRFSKDPTTDNDRIAFRLDYSPEEDAFQIRFNQTAWAIETAENINLAFVFTDGIGRVVETQLNSNNPGITEVIKQNIARIPQKTYDDKTLIVLERIINP
jgi:hypothetical protein